MITIIRYSFSLKLQLILHPKPLIGSLNIVALLTNILIKIKERNLVKVI